MCTAVHEGSRGSGQEARGGRKAGQELQGQPHGLLPRPLSRKCVGETSERALLSALCRLFLTKQH